MFANISTLIIAILKIRNVPLTPGASTSISVMRSNATEIFILNPTTRIRSNPTSTPKTCLMNMRRCGIGLDKAPYPRRTKKNQYRKFDAMMRFGAGRTNKGFNGGKHIESAVDKMNSDVTDFNFARNHEDGLSTMFKLGCIFVLLALLTTLIAQTTRDYQRYDWVREAAKAKPKSKDSGIFGNMNQLSGILGQLGGLADANGADGAGGGNILNQLLGIMGGGDGDGEMPDLGGLMNQFAGGGEGKEGGENPFAGLIGQMADGLQKAGGEGGDQKGDNPLGGLGGMLDQFMGAAKNDGKEGGENGGGIGDMLNQFMGAAKNDGKDGGDVKDGNFNDLIGNFVKNLGGGEKKE
eukprot:855607_1